MRKAIYLPAFLLSIGFFYSCSSDEDLIPVNTEITRSINTRAVNVNDSIMPFEGNRDTLKRPIQLYTSMEVEEELRQLEDIPFYLQVQGNSSSKQFLSASSAGSEVTVQGIAETLTNNSI